MHKSFVLFLGFFPLAMIAFELLQQPVQGMALHSAPSFLFLALVDKTVHFPVFLVASVILASLQGVILVLKPYIILYTFIFDIILEQSRTLSSTSWYYLKHCCQFI